MKSPAFFPKSLSLLFLVLAGALCAKSADMYFHGGGHKYVQGRIQEASIEIEEGVRAHPQDKRLTDFAEYLRKLKDEQKQQDGDQQQNKQEQQEGQDQEKPEDSGEQDRQQDKPPEDKPEDQEGKSDPKPDEGSEKPEEEKPKPDAARPQPQPGEMSEEEAERLLRAFEADEKEQRKKAPAPAQRGGGDVDW